VNWIAENNIRFNTDVAENRGAIWGRIQNDIVTINKNVLIEAMNKTGFDFMACSRKWEAEGKIKLNSQGYITHQTKVSGIKGNYIKFVLPADVPEWVEVEKDTNLPW
jgi:hypothetical protein